MFCLPTTAYRQPTAGTGRPREKTRKTRRTGKSGKTRKTGILVPPVAPTPSLFTGIFFDTRAPRAHLKPALRIVGGEATDLSAVAGESCKAVKKRRRQTLCLRSIRFRLCDSRLRQRCGAWLLRHFCHQKWQRTLRNFVAHKYKSGWHLPLLGKT